MNTRKPIGIELVKRGIVKETDIEIALDYQKIHPDKKLCDILCILNLCSQKQLLDAMGEIFGEKAILLSTDDVKIKDENIIPLDICQKYKVIAFDKIGNIIKVCFADTFNIDVVDKINNILINQNLIMDKYLSFESNIENVLKALENKENEVITDDSEDIVNLVDTIIKKAIEKRASDIHIEPLENFIRIRFRIDGELISIANIDKANHNQLVGRLKVISNMYQEKQDAQNGRINLYPNYDIRVASQKTINGEKFSLRLLKKNEIIRNVFDLGINIEENKFKKYFDKRNSITIIAAPTGEGKTTTLYGILNYLNKPEINITTVEDPVEIKFDGINQIEITENSNFSTALKSILRNDPDIILLGEIRDKESAEIAIQAGQTGHYVLSTIHTINSIEVITRLRKMGISDYDISSTLATSVSQRLIRKVCPHCAVKREFLENEKNIINSIASKYNVCFDFNEKFTYDIKGCEFCNYTGYYDRIGVFEFLEITDAIRELIASGESTLKIRNIALKEGYLPLEIDALKKVVDGISTLDEVNKKLVLY